MVKNKMDVAYDENNQVVPTEVFMIAILIEAHIFLVSEVVTVMAGGDITKT